MSTLAETIDDSAPLRRWTRWAALLVLALAVRGGAMVLLNGRLDRDADSYAKIAENVRNLNSYARPAGDQDRLTAYRPPLYPLLLAPLVFDGKLSRGAVATLHVLLGAATVMVVHELGRHIGMNRGAVLAAALVLLDPILIYQSAEVMTETLATFLAATALLGLTRFSIAGGWRWASVCGAILGLAGLCRPTFLPLIGMAALLGPWTTRHRAEPPPSHRQRALETTAMALAALLVLAPWAARNALVFGRPILGTTHGGYTVLLGNNPGFYEFLRRADRNVWDSQNLDDRAWREFRRTGFDELELDRWANREALKNIREEPAMFLYSCLVRVARLWGVLPHQVGDREGALRRAARYLVALWYAALFGVALYGAARLRGDLLRAPWLWCLVLCGVFTAVHLIYWSNLRMRAPLAPAICLAAAAGLCKRSAKRPTSS